VIEDSVIMGCDFYETVDDLKEDQSHNVPALGIGFNCHIRGAILDKNVRIGDNVRIVNEKKQDTFDGEQYSIRDGIVIIPKGAIIPSGTVI